MSWDLYNRKLTATGYTSRDRQLNQLKEDFFRESVKNPSFHMAIRNEDIEQPFIITRSEVPEKYKIVAFPGDDIADGDYIDVFGERFIVVQTRVDDTMQKSGTMWLCNHEFVWQNFSSDIIKRWGVLDSGVYSSTITGEKNAKVKNKQFKLYLPLDADTCKIFVDKRIAVDKMYDKFGNEIMNVYQITGFDGTSESFGRDAHLLILNLRSDEYNRNTDNSDLMICDYIEPEDSNDDTDLLKCEISGSKYIRVGSSRNYTPTFYDSNDLEVLNVIANWSLTEDINGVSLSQSNNKLTITVSNIESLVGQSIELNLKDDSGNYETTTIKIDLIGL